MKSLFLFLYLISIIIVCTKTTPQKINSGIKKENQQFKRKIQNNRSIQKNNKSEAILNTPQTKKNSSKRTFKKNQLQMLNILKPLFGLRKKDQNRDKNGKTAQKSIKNDTNLPKNIKEEFNNYSENEHLVMIWDQSMGDFEPEVTLTFDVPSGNTEIFFEDISKPTTIKGAFFITQLWIDDKIDFFIKSSNNTMVYSKEKVKEAIFNIDILEKGEYKFIFQNKRSKNILTITFTLDVHDSEQEFLKMEDLDPLAFRIERISMAMKDNYYFDKISGQQFEGNLREVQSANKQLLLFSLFEIIGVIIITTWQVFYLKRIVGNQRLF